MRCWNCRNEVPMSPFCRNCGAALPDPETRRVAITSRLAELSTERTILEAQLQRLGAAAPTPAVVSPATVSAATVSADIAAPVVSPAAPVAAASTVVTSAPRVPSPPKQPLFSYDLSPATVITLIGVVLLAAASFVSAKENPALISLSHGTRLLLLAVELVAASAATLYLAPRRNTLADAFGALTWSAALSFGLLASVHVRTGLRDDLWTYALPFLVGGLVMALARRNLEFTRFVGAGTVAFGVIHVAYFGLNPNVNGYQFSEFVPMARGAVVMALIAVVASMGMWVSFSPRLASITRAERLLAGITVGSMLLVSFTAPLPVVTNTASGFLALLGELSMAVPLIVASLTLHRRGDTPNGVIGFGVAGGLVAMAFLAGALLGVGDVPTRFPGSRSFTLFFPVIYIALASAFAFAATRFRSVASTYWTLAVTALIPSLGALFGTLRWELVGGLGRDGFAPIGDFDLSTTGWFGRGVTIGDVSPLIIALSGVALLGATVVLSRRTSLTQQRLWRQVSGIVGTISAVAVALRFTEAAMSTVIFSIVFLAGGAALFAVSRCVRDDAPVDEWMPVLYVAVGLLASLGRNAAYQGHHNGPGGLTMTGLALVTLAATATALRRRSEIHSFVGWALVMPALSGIAAIHSTPELAWQMGTLGLGSLFLLQGLSLYRVHEHQLKLNAGSGLLFGALYAYLTQIISMVNSGYDFRLGVALVVLSVTMAVAERRRATLGVLLVAPAALTGIYWGAHIHDFDFSALWIAGAVVLLGALLVPTRHDVTNSWATYGPALVMAFAASDVALLQGSHSHVPGLGEYALVVAGALVALLGLRFKTEAALEIGAISMAVAGVSNQKYSLAFLILTVSIGSIFLLAAAQQAWVNYRLTGRSKGVVALAGGISLLESFQLASSTHHTAVALALSLAAILLLAATRRCGAVFDARFVLIAGAAEGAVWSRSFHEVNAPGLWLAGGALALLALTWNQDRPDHASWNEWGPSLALTMIPANYLALTGSSLSAAIAIAAAVVLVIIGVQLKKRAVFDVAIATFALLSIARLSQVVSDQGRWVVAVIVGVALVGNGFWRETRKKSDGGDLPVTSWYRSLQ